MARPIRFPRQAPPPAPTRDVSVADVHTATTVGFSIGLRLGGTGDTPAMDVELRHDDQVYRYTISPVPPPGVGWSLWVAHNHRAITQQILPLPVEAHAAKAALTDQVRELIAAGWRIVRDVGLETPAEYIGR